MLGPQLHRLRRPLLYLVLVLSMVLTQHGLAWAITSWTSRTSGATSTLNGVAYGNGVWVAVGGTGTITTSSDNGVTWNKTSNGTSTIYDVCYVSGLGLWVAVGNSGRILTSPDAITWTQQTNIAPSIGTISLRGVISDGIDIVAVGASGQVVRSTNGTVWTSSSAGMAGFWKVAYGTGAFVATGDSGAIRRSVDFGQSWNNTTPPGLTTILNGIAYGNGRFVVSGVGGLVSQRPACGNCGLSG